jgi:hypothetical protein
LKWSCPALRLMSFPVRVSFTRLETVLWVFIWIIEGVSGEWKVESGEWCPFFLSTLYFPLSTFFFYDLRPTMAETFPPWRVTGCSSVSG